MDPISRRHFLTAAVGVLLTACGKRVSTPPDDEQVITLEEKTREQMLVKGPLPQNVRTCIAAAVLAVIGRTVDVGRYVSCFAWRAENLPGFLHEYNQFALAADQVAAQLYSSTFANAKEDQRRDILMALMGKAHPGFNPPKRLRQSVRGYVVHEMHLIFARTDGWLALGYDGWPGTARGLDAYTQEPARRL